MAETTQNQSNSDIQLVSSQTSEAPGSFQQDVRADVVNIEQGGAGSVEAKTVTVTQGGIQTVNAEHVEIQEGGIGHARANDITINQGGAGFVQAEQVTMRDGTAGVLVGNTVDATNVQTGAIFARQVNGDVQAAVTEQTAAIFGVVAGLVAGAVLFLLFRRR
jgi:hypothetical protein